MHVFITGGAGFIGSHLTKFHLDKHDEVVVLDDLSSGSLNNIADFKNNPLFQFYHGSILDYQDFDKYVKWADRIYHMAAIVGIFQVISNPIKVLETNINGCDRLLKTISKLNVKPIVIIASSSSVYGQNTSAVLREDSQLILNKTNFPIASYVISKLAEEELAQAYFKTKDVPVIITRLFNIIGPNQTGSYGMVVPRFIQQTCNNDPITVYGDGKQTRSFCDVRDVVNMLDSLAKNPNTPGEIINVGNDQEITINELAELIRKQTNSSSVIQHIPYQTAYGQDYTDIVRRRPDLQKLFHLIHYRPQWNLKKSIDNLIQYHVSNIHLKA